MTQKGEIRSTIPVSLKNGWNKHILIVDDEKEIADLVEVYLRGEGYEVELPKDFKEIEIGLRQIQLDTRTSAQEAHDAEQRKNDMIMYMAHDLKTPLTSVIGYLTLVDEEKELPDTAREKYISIALKKALRLEELINGFFDITRYNFTHMVLEKTTVIEIQKLLFR